MDLNVECDSSAMGSLFQQIIIDMKNTSPLWEDFVAKASKLHTCLKAVIQAIASYLDAFQKIADAATHSRGASKEIGTALTRVCLRHKAVETRMKTFTSAIMDCLILPLQDKIEDWKRQVVAIDKEHAKEYKKCRTELKKRSNDTLRLQKKARKDQSDSILSLVDSHMHDVSLRRAELEEVERKSLRAAMIEERVRFCTFVNMLQPVVKEECEVMSELGHLQEAMESIAAFTKDPRTLPQSSEEIIQETKPSLTLYPESPGGGSLGSRKSSVCSINSVNSSGSSGSPSHHHYQRSLSQLISPTMRLKPGESSDSGFCSSPVLTKQSSATTSQLHTVSTWPPHSQDVTQTTDRPHTISSAYEKGHQRPPLTVYTFQKPETIIESQKSPASMSCRPPLPVRCSSLERPTSASALRNSNVNFNQRQCPSPIPVHIAKELPQFQPTYANMSELTSLSGLKSTNNQTHQLLQPFPKPLKSPNQSTTSSQISSDSSTGNSHQLHSSSDLSLSAMTTYSAMSATLLESTIPSSNENLSPIISQTIDPSNSYNNCKLNVERSETTDTFTETSCEGELKITETDIIANDLSRIPSGNKDVLSPESDDISRASVQQKASLFEKLERQQNANNNTLNASCNRSSLMDNNIVNKNKKEEIYKPGGWNEKDSEKLYEDSIQELNNLIGELDSFQREHDLEHRDKLEKDHPLVAVSADVLSDQISAGTYSSSAQSLNESRCIGIDQSPSQSECMIEMETSSSINSEKNIHDNSKPVSIMNNNHADLTYDTYDIEYLKENSAVVVLRCKDPRKSHCVGNNLKSISQRLSSFQLEQMKTNSQAVVDHRVERALHENSGSLVEGCATRMTRRSSSNNIKPPPPVRRSSSVTPSLNTHTPSSLHPTHDNALNVSADSLPPPPAFLLDRAGNEPIPVNVAETVKALTVIKHTPASPTVLRRAQSQQLQISGTEIYSTSSPPSSGVYAQPKQITKMSSFRTPSPAPQKSGSNIIAHINARLLPHKQSNTTYNIYQQHQAVQDVRSSQQQYNYQQYAEKNEVSCSLSEEAKKIANWNDKQSSHQSDDYTAAGNILNKSKAEFLHNLNVKLAKQGLSGRAFAVRNLINHKARPDPRVCHESLMDQIKRGATLKRNRTINDRSAPKIR